MKARVAAAVACLLLSSAAFADEAVWYVPISLVAMDGDTSSIGGSGAVPSVAVHERSALGLAAGLGYRTKKGVEWSASLLHVNQDIDLSASSPSFGAVSFSADTSRMGLVLSCNIPLRFK
jgi:opacity protein-like surface antigen